MDIASAVPVDEARDRVGAAMFGAAWIGKLTHRERHLLKNYYQVWEGEEIKSYGEGLGQEIARARDRTAEASYQDRKVYDLLERWIVEDRIKVSADGRWIEPAGLVQAITAEFSGTKNDPSATASGLAGAAPAAPARLGRPPIWDWEGAIIEMLGAIHNDILHDISRSSLTKFLNDWFANRHGGDGPSDSEIRKRIARIASALKI